MKGRGTKLLRSDGQDPENFEAIAEIKEFPDIVLMKETFDDTTFDSEGDYEEVGSGRKKMEPLDLKVKYNKDAAVAAKVRADYDTDKKVRYRIEWPDEQQTTLTFDCIVTKIVISSPEQESVTESFTFTPSGKPVWG